MDQNTVEKLHEYGSFMVLLDVPRGTEFSIDWNSWKGFLFDDFIEIFFTRIFKSQKSYRIWTF